MEDKTYLPADRPTLDGTFWVDKDGNIGKSILNAENFVGKPLRDVIGKNLSDRILADGSVNIDGDGLRAELDNDSDNHHEGSAAGGG